jgi:uncharacterized protein (DUF2141 family)
MRNIITGLLLLSLAGVSWGHNITITVENISKAGELHIAIYDSKEAFEEDRGEQGGPAPGIVDGLIIAATPGKFSHDFDLPTGTYAIGVFHDVNGNNSLDTNFLGIPKEQYGFGNDATGSFGPPSFDEAAIKVSKDATYTIILR